MRSHYKKPDEYFFTAHSLRRARERLKLQLPKFVDNHELAFLSKLRELLGASLNQFQEGRFAYYLVPQTKNTYFIVQENLVITVHRVEQLLT